VQKVAIVSYGIIPYTGVGELGMWNDEATFLVAKQALDKVGLNAEDLDAAVLSTMDGLDGLTISNSLLAPAAGGYRKETNRIENSGIHCTISGIAAILSGTSDLVMIASADSIKADFNYVTNSTQEALFRGPLAFNHFQGFGLLAMECLKNNATEDDFALAASKNYQSGSSNQYAHVKNAYTVDEVKEAPMVSWPLRSLEIAGLSNGAAAILLASEEKAKELTENPLWITGQGAGINPYFGSWQELSGMAALKKAAQKAYESSGIKEPEKELDFLEIATPFSPFEIMAYEALSICKEGGGASLLRDGVTSVDGDVPVNVSGGSFCANGPNSSGIYRIIQAMMILNNELKHAGNQDMNKGLVHDSDMVIGAVGGDSHAVLVLEKEA
jgi:acetyl-CoA C-acetyltransferase